MTDFDRDDETTPEDGAAPDATPSAGTGAPGAGAGTGAPGADAGTGAPAAGAGTGATPPPASTPPSIPPPASTPPAPAPVHGGGMSAQDQRNWAAGSHLSALLLAFFGGLAVLGPLVVYLLKKDEDAFVAEHSREALNFQLTWLVGGFVLGLVGVVLAVVTIGFGLIVLVPLALGLFVAWVVFTIKGGVAASRGEYYRYPLTVRMVS